MKKLTSSLYAAFLFFLFSCSGSDAYRGMWKAMDKDGTKFEITFDANSFIVKDSIGQNTKFDYTQNSVNIENYIETYGIQLKDGRTFQINFPYKNDESQGFIKDGNGNPIYTISRDTYVKFSN